MFPCLPWWRSLLFATSKLGFFSMKQYCASRKHLFLCPQGGRSGLTKQKTISINTNHSYHQHSSPGVNLNWSTNKIWFNFNQPIREKWGASLVNVIKHLLYKVILLWQHHHHLDPLASITNVFSRSMVF